MQQLVVRDRDGRVRARLGCDADGGPELSLMDPGGTPRVVAALCKGVPLLGLSDAAGRPRVLLALESESVASLRLLGAGGAARVDLSSCHDAGQVHMYDAGGRLRLIVGVEEAGGIIQVMDNHDGLGAGLAFLHGAAGLSLAAGEGGGRTELHLTADGHHRVRAGSGPRGGPAEGDGTRRDGRPADPPGGRSAAGGPDPVDR